ncbi:MAG: response regulator receiver sensor signal transduction histidine kinase [Proteobacteria bacterium]|nr:response regulator receiver sensor signal transduction histidine kinase [Pseudomonadota bacterium]
MARILVIEDDPTIRANLARVLRFENHEVIVAEDGHVGLQAARTECPQLILCDIMMPRMDGISVLNALRPDSQLSVIPFVFLTARADRAEVEAKLTFPADDYLIKPFNLQELLAVVNRQLENQRKLYGLSDSR